MIIITICHNRKHSLTYAKCSAVNSFKILMENEWFASVRNVLCREGDGDSDDVTETASKRLN